MILDCQTNTSALATLSAIVGIAPKRLCEHLAGFKGDDWPDDPPRYLWREIVGGDREFEGVYWFHLSRVLDPNAFRRLGILPLNNMIDQIWLMLSELAGGDISASDKAQLPSCINTGGHSGFLYKLKVDDRVHWGPYAMLVRDAALSPGELMNHDYLETPEIVADICDCINQRFGVDLLPRFCEASHACIVKFVGPPDRPDVLPIAMMYLWAMQHNAGLGSSSNTCFDGHGERVRPNQIVDVEVDP